jgi:uncharacterized protein
MLAQMTMQGNRPFPPRVSAFTRPFWDALSEDRFVTVRCDDCGTRSFPPRHLCRACWSRSLSWIELAPRGVLYSFTRVHVAPARFRNDAPYAIAIVDLADGLRLMCRLLDDVGPADLDAAIEMVVLRYDDGPLFAARVLR